MKHDSVRCVGFDCGNSSVRTVIGLYDGNSVTSEVILQVPNRAITVNGVDFWDILKIFESMQTGLKAAENKYGEIDSVGISTWGIDFGILGTSGHLLGNPLCYRNIFGLKGLESIDTATKKQLFDLSGIQNHPMNSMYQLLGIRDMLPEYYEGAKDILFIPDLLNFMFTGEKGTENTIASTSQLLDMRTQDYSDKIFQVTNLDRSMFHPVVPHGKERGVMLGSIAKHLEIDSTMPFISVPSHDTASAVVSVPATEDNFIFISSGTWSLIGTELDEPIINDKVYDHSFANEGGAADTITLLKNSAGMHILQNVKHELEQLNNRKFEWPELISMASGAGLSVALYDPNHQSLYNPEKMIDAIIALTGESEIERILASSFISLACSYREAIADLEDICGHGFEAVHIIGGGSRNAYLNQLTADITDKPVITGPEEATSLGTIASQVLYHDGSATLKKVRAAVAKGIKTGTFTPGKDFPREETYGKYTRSMDRSKSLS
ncbi:MAG: carbohydrate kinase [Spirochaetales bacterium]|nr:carbohydrate kinase [Spirochaetales bacterium]